MMKPNILKIYTFKKVQKMKYSQIIIHFYNMIFYYYYIVLLKL